MVVFLRGWGVGYYQFVVCHPSRSPCLPLPFNATPAPFLPLLSGKEYVETSHHDYHLAFLWLVLVLFLVSGMGVFELHNAKMYCLRFGVAPQTPIPLYLIGQERCFWISGTGCLNCIRLIFFLFWGGAPNTRTTIPHRPAKVFLDTSEGGV